MERKKIIDLDQGNSYIQVALVRGFQPGSQIDSSRLFSAFYPALPGYWGSTFLPGRGKNRAGGGGWSK
jgi:hypothetical protein